LETGDRMKEAIMYSQSTIALVAALSTFAFAVPTVSHAENQSEWLHRQLKITDGYAPPPVLPAQDGDRAGASAIRRGAFRTSHPRKPAPRPRVVFQQPANAYEANACQEACAGGERPPAQARCAECGVIESTREVDMHGEGSGLAAVGVLLVLAGFKVRNIVGAIQQG
jgi:hypothetical protein